MNKQITLEEAVAKVHDGMTIMFAGFLGVGSAVQIIDRPDSYGDWRRDFGHSSGTVPGVGRPPVCPYP